MLSHVFLGLSLVGAEWVLYLLVLLSILSIAIIFERLQFYRAANRGLVEFRKELRAAGEAGRWDDAQRTAQTRVQGLTSERFDLESELAFQLLKNGREKKLSAEVLTELARDSVVRSRLGWERNLSILATIGSNAPFIGLFGTVLGIIKAFHDLSQQAGGSPQTVTSGISEALVATAVGLIVAIPAVVAFNIFQRRVKAAMSEAEALKSFLIAKLAE